MNRFLPWVCCLIVSGCFLQQKEPTDTSVKKVEPIYGRVSLETLRAGNQSDGSFEAVFGKQSEANRAITERGAYISRFSRALALEQAVEKMGMPVRGLADGRSTSRCSFAKEPKSGRKLPRQEQRISVGEVGFGPAMQSVLTPVPLNDKKVYSLQLSPEFPAGTYVVQVGGKDTIPGFTHPLVMPEELRDPKVNGSLLSSGGVLKRTDGVQVQWVPLAVAVSNSVMLMNLLLETDKEYQQLLCLDLETNLSLGSESSWNFPSTLLSQFTEPGFVTVFLSRVAALVPSDKDKEVVDVLFQGMRTHAQIYELQ